MTKLEQELTFVDNTNETGLLDIDTKCKPEISSSPQVSPNYNHTGNPVMSQHTHRIRPTPPISKPIQGGYIKEEKFNLPTSLENASVTFPEVIPQQRTQVQNQPMIFQQVVQSPVFVNLGPAGNIQPMPDKRSNVIQVDNVPQVNKTSPLKQQSQPLLIQNNPKGVPFILKSSDSNFSPVLLQSNIINPKTQTLMYTSTPLQGKYRYVQILFYYDVMIMIVKFKWFFFSILLIYPVLVYHCTHYSKNVVNNIQ